MRKPNTLTLLALLLIATACQTSSYTWRGNLYQQPQSAPHFELASTQGDVYDLSQQRGRIVLLFFGYTYCPDVCPATVGDAAWLLDHLGPDADQVDFAFITVDPERDTLEQLEAYLGLVNERLIGLRPEPEDLEGLQSAFGVTVVVEPNGDPDHYFITHTARIFLVDQDGLLRANYDFATPRADLLADLEHLLERDT
jgi:protein SCO1/2